MSTPEPPWGEDERERVLKIDKKWSAIRQLETAIMLWFHYDAPVSIHTLSKAANDLFSALSHRKAEQKSFFTVWRDSQSQGDAR